MSEEELRLFKPQHSRDYQEYLEVSWRAVHLVKTTSYNRCEKFTE